MDYKFFEESKAKIVVDGIVTKNVDINKGVPQETVISPFLMVDDIKPKQAETKQDAYSGVYSACKQRNVMRTAVLIKDLRMVIGNSSVKSC